MTDLTSKLSCAATESRAVVRRERCMSAAIESEANREKREVVGLTGKLSWW